MYARDYPTETTRNVPGTSKQLSSSPRYTKAKQGNKREATITYDKCLKKEVHNTHVAPVSDRIRTKSVESGHGIGFFHRYHTE